MRLTITPKDVRDLIAETVRLTREAPASASNEVITARIFSSLMAQQ